MTKKKILITADSYLPRKDGVAIYLSEIVPRLAKYYDITLITPAYPGKIKQPKDFKLIRLPLLKIQFGDMVFANFNLKRLKQEVQNYDLVFNQSIGPIGISSIRAAKKHKIPIISYVHMLEWELTAASIGKFKVILGYLTKKVAKYLYNKCQLLLVPYAEVDKKLKNAGIKTKQKTIHLGTNTARFIPPLSKKNAKKKIGIKNKFTIGYVGRIGREKDIPTLCNAFRTLKPKYHDIQLLIVGSGLKHEVLKYKDETVIIRDAVEDVVPYLQALDVYVLPSQTETTSLSTIEAMSCGLPVVCTPVGFIKYYIKNKKNGIFFKKQDTDMLAAILDNLIADEELRTELGQNARKTIINKFTWDRTAEEMKKIFDKL